MKKVLIILLCFNLCLLSGCGEEKQPELSTVQNICQMASLECYYHNVAKEEDIDTFLGLKDKKYWLEYTGTVKLGVDLDKVKMEVKGQKVIITLPDIEIVSSNVDEKSLSLIDDKGIFAEDTDVMNMVESAQKNMEEEAMRNEKVLLQAEDRIKVMLQEYIDTISSVSKKAYTIEWKSLEG